MKKLNLFGKNKLFDTADACHTVLKSEGTFLLSGPGAGDKKSDGLEMGTENFGCNVHLLAPFGKNIKITVHKVEMASDGDHSFIFVRTSFWLEKDSKIHSKFTINLH